MNKRNIVILIIIAIILAISISNVSATPSKVTIKTCDNCGDKVTLYINEDIIKNYGLVKKNGKYYHKYDTNYIYYGFCSNCGNFVEGKSSYYYKYVPVKKGEIVKKSNYKKYKTVESKSKVYNFYKYKKTVAITPSKLKTVTATTKKLTAYYKKIKMPTMKKGSYKYTRVGGQDIYYGRDSYYYVDTDYPEEIKVYAPGRWAQSTSKYTVTGFYFASKNTYKPVKPKWFKVYVKA